MREYQRQYIENLTRVIELNDLAQDLNRDAVRFLTAREEKRRIIRRLILDNTSLLRRELFPVLDNITSASDDEIRELEDFCAALTPGGNQLDVMLNYTIRNSLIVYARHWKKRDMLIRELYHAGMAVFGLFSSVETIDPDRYRWKMQLLFGEAASCIKVYDEIEDPEIRGYIHRSMANLALGYSTGDAETSIRKMNVIRRSLQVLTDPVFHQKTPSLPWNTFIYKSHQERTTSLVFLRSGVAGTDVMREVMESAEYVWQKQLENSKRTGRAPSTRWHLTYDQAQYYCGILTLEQLLRRIEKLYMQRNTADFSEDGIYCNIFVPNIYADFLTRNDQYKLAKKEVLGHMYRMMLQYVRSVPADQMNIVLIRNLMTTFINFVEYPDGIKQKDFLLQLVVCHDPEAFVYLHMTACVSRMLLNHALQQKPELLIGVLGCENTDQVRAMGSQLADLAYDSGMFHNIGQLNFTRMTALTGRNWMKEEQELFRYHVTVGARILERCESTRLYADAAAGHHRYYDGKGGYPESYDRREHPNQAIVDIVNIAAYFNRLLNNAIDYTKEPMDIPEALKRIRGKSGTRFSPELVKLFIEMKPELEEYYKGGRLAAYKLAFTYLKNEEEMTY